MDWQVSGAHSIGVCQMSKPRILWFDGKAALSSFLKSKATVAGEFGLAGVREEGINENQISFDGEYGA